MCIDLYEILIYIHGSVVLEPNYAKLEPQSYNSSSIIDVRVEYHPNSGLAPQAMTLNDYRETDASLSPPPQERPWWPYFNSREDFELAELMLESSLSQKQCNKLLDIFQRCAKGSGSVTLSSHGDMQSRWKDASNLLTSVRIYSF